MLYLISSKGGPLRATKWSSHKNIPICVYYFKAVALSKSKAVHSLLPSIAPFNPACPLVPETQACGHSKLLLWHLSKLFIESIYTINPLPPTPTLPGSSDDTPPPPVHGFAASFRCEVSSLVQPSRSFQQMTAQAFVYGEFAGSLGMTDRAFVWGQSSRIQGKTEKSASWTFYHHPTICLSSPWSWKKYFCVLILSPWTHLVCFLSASKVFLVHFSHV